MSKVLVDTSKCTACRGCQSACKNWNQLPAELTRFTGSYENPPAFLPYTWCRVTFNEYMEGGAVKWYFAKLQCMHCAEPACMNICPEGAISRTFLGSVTRDWDKCVGCGKCGEVCPHQVPKVSSLKKMMKCDFCYDRTSAGEPPACVATCPSGALTFGDDTSILAAASARASQIGGTVYGEDNLFVYVLLRNKSDYKIEPGPLNPGSGPGGGGPGGGGGPKPKDAGAQGAGGNEDAGGGNADEDTKGGVKKQAAAG
jgi:formate dehydrogenase iron-sulfur subunit